MAYHFTGHIEGIDISPTVIEEMKKKHQQKAEQIGSVEYKVLDATKMHDDHTFGAVIDKGTFDALNCGDFSVVEQYVACMEYPLDSLGDGVLIIVSQISQAGQMRAFLFQLIPLFDWESYKYACTIYTMGEELPAVYVFTKKKRTPGETIDVSEDMNHFEVSIVNCGDDVDEEEEMDEEEDDKDEEFVVESEETDEYDYIIDSDLDD